jgi:hypothetical protein
LKQRVPQQSHRAPPRVSKPGTLDQPLREKLASKAKERLGQSTPERQATAAAAQQAAVEAYKANLKFNVMGKEHEFDTFLHGVIKDADAEKKVRELYEKAYGLDVVKPRLKDAQEKYKQLDSAHKQVQMGITELRETYQRGDLDGFFKKLNIPQEKVLQWVLDKANYNQLPPDQRKVLDAQRAAEERAYSLEQQTASYQAQLQEQASHAKRFELQVALERPDIKAFSEAFDSRVGKANAFIEEIANRGEYAWATKGIDRPVNEVIGEIMKLYGGLAPQPTQAPAPQVDTQPKPRVEQRPAQQTTILPKVEGRPSQSPMKSKPKSLDDLRKLAKQFETTSRA